MKRSIPIAVALSCLLLAAAWVGTTSARRRIPEAFSHPDAWAPIGQKLPVLSDRAPAAMLQRNLNDFLFASAAGIPSETLPFSSEITHLVRGQMVEVLRADLGFLLVRLSEKESPLWIEATALGIEPPKKSRGPD